MTVKELNFELKIIFRGTSSKLLMQGSMINHHTRACKGAFASFRYQVLCVQGTTSQKGATEEHILGFLDLCEGYVPEGNV